MDGFYVAKFKKLENKFDDGKEKKDKFSVAQGNTAQEEEAASLAFNDEEDAKLIKESLDRMKKKKKGLRVPKNVSVDSEDAEALS